ncbi:MAG TPA: cysteine methyltransferase, partial [Paraburkholderia sp.]|nr:cysteine methyltransferase [Paraburkholderia sp.]
MKHCILISSPLGDILLRAEDDALTGLYFVGQKYFPKERIDHTGENVSAAARLLRQTQEQLAEYFAGERQR